MVGIRSYTNATFVYERGDRWRVETGWEKRRGGGFPREKIGVKTEAVSAGHGNPRRVIFLSIFSTLLTLLGPRSLILKEIPQKGYPEGL